MSEKSGSDWMTHDPLPYVVKLRAIPKGDDDEVARELPPIRLMAYSVLEALMQAILQAGGNGLEDDRFKVEAIEPDLQAYASQMLDRMIQAVRTR